MSIIGIRGFRRNKNKLVATLAPVVGYDTFPATGTKHITVGFKPAYLIVTRTIFPNQATSMQIYSKDYATDKFRFAASNSYSKDVSLGTTGSGYIYSIDSDGFTLSNATQDYALQYIAIPENYGGEVAIGEFTYSTTANKSIELGFKPEYLAITKIAGNSGNHMDIYSEDYNQSKSRHADTSVYAQDSNLGGTTTTRLYSIDDAGFTVTKSNTSAMQYIAVGRIPKTPKFPVVGVSTYPTSGTKHIELGFKPAYLGITKTSSSTQNTMMIFSRDYATDKFRDADSSHYARDLSLGGSDVTRLFSIDDSGFTINKYSSAQEFQYIAVPRDYKGNVKVGEITYSITEQTHINCGFKPKYILMTKTPSTANTSMFIYSEDYSTSKYLVAAASAYAQNNNLGTTNNGAIYSIDDDGFTVNKNNSESQVQYIAIGEKGDIAPHINGLKQTSVLYTGSAATSEVDTDLILGTDYTVDYSNNVDKGTATATIRGIGAYSGSVSFNYEVTDYVVGTFNYDATSETQINLGFKPAYLLLTRTTKTPQSAGLQIYSKDYSTTKYRYADGTNYATDKSMPSTNSGTLKSINNDGFTMNKSASVSNVQYIAIPESYSGNVAIGDFTWTTSENTHVNVGFKPKYLAITKKPIEPTDPVMLVLPGLTITATFR